MHQPLLSFIILLMGPGQLPSSEITINARYTFHTALVFQLLRIQYLFCCLPAFMGKLNPVKP